MREDHIGGKQTALGKGQRLGSAAAENDLHTDHSPHAGVLHDIKKKKTETPNAKTPAITHIYA
jgi:hypothetical protein